MEVVKFTCTRYDVFYIMQGGWENDETVEEAAIREAVEEAGVRGELLVRTNLYYNFIDVIFLKS